MGDQTHVQKFCWKILYNSQALLATINSQSLEDTQVEYISQKYTYYYYVHIRSDVEWCGVVWSGVVWSGVVWSGVEWCDVGWSGVVKGH